MSLQKITNGLESCLLTRDAEMFKLIAAEFELDEERIAEVVYEALKKNNTVKLKMQARKPQANGGQKAAKKRSGYQEYRKAHQEEIKQLLLTKPAERKFKNKAGKLIEISEDDFRVLKNGTKDPKFEHIGKKCASMWALLPEAEKQKYNDLADVENKKAQSKTESTSEAQSQSESEPKTKKKGAGRKMEVVEKQPVAAKKQPAKGKK